ncbi:alpha-N-acetylgalactosaminide alpha-2,6-sialyltransferase 2 isoform X3 [Elephas maximus indicus]|uniref:alpha-N-acetylgalactosaminide alpha-2,6-sialyltransferase 2 isoform X3 n=1 Tax=Elephas maximus indicus TaxID=99487 RepID=UPI002116C693|nr:alpha-N-acetylgalactosaminide alpha-2,6-sialyltransferase 2 isoform X3 [Elephas maximus indicus]
MTQTTGDPADVHNSRAHGGFPCGEGREQVTEHRCRASREKTILDSCGWTLSAPELKGDTMTSQAFFGSSALNFGTRKSRLCRCPLHFAIQRHPHFRRLFNLSTPVLLWGRPFTQELWDSLSQHKAPYGWQGLSHQAIASTLNLLNGSENAELFAASKELRPDCIRLNGAVIKDFEDDVGTRTSFYGFTVNTMKNSLISYRKLGFTSVPQRQDLHYIFIPSDIRDYVMLRSAILGVPVPEGTDKGDKPQTYFGPEASASKFKLLHPDFIRYLTERFLKSELMNTNFRDLYMPSTGALMLLTALHTCDQVSAYGFITRNYRKFSDHYFDRIKKPLIFYANHDLHLEAALWGDLHKAGIIWLYQR